eukprot:TRINITY_DN989_c0_g1_i7.p3 TRINITY_DN989_c0_g1~~TRINITY_DN989_c0_g1_i7.p3  ORF type:complete len:164 (-),score=43.40 TRINITY_DN989_c0_g1_i7:102-593(-)
MCIRDRTYTVCGTPEYLAPEIILHKGHGKAADWWAFGILVYEFLVGIDPFSDDEPLHIYQNILKGKLKFPLDFDSNAKSLIKRLLQQDVSKRLGNLKGGNQDIKEHRLFDGVQWNEIYRMAQEAPYVPVTKGQGDTRNFEDYPESGSQTEDIEPDKDPFLKWQ